MRKIKLVIGAIVSVIIIAAIAVNFLPSDKVKNYTLSSYCSDITKNLMKSPSSYKLIGHSTDWTVPTRDEVDATLSVYKHLKDKKDLQWSKVYSENRFVASNSFGVELSGFAKCDFMRIYFGADSYYYTLINVNVDGKKIDGFSLASAEISAKASVGDISTEVTYMQKIKYLLSKV
ncbi:MAG TPA: hypothetical protein DIT05_01635 [Morganella sp. (in: Bacteria)]|nr:hypothetical protein [Morganella sp. (in: enterobacteria)]